MVPASAGGARGEGGGVAGEDDIDDNFIGVSFASDVATGLLSTAINEDALEARAGVWAAAMFSVDVAPLAVAGPTGVAAIGRAVLVYDIHTIPMKTSARTTKGKDSRRESSPI